MKLLGVVLILCLTQTCNWFSPTKKETGEEFCARISGAYFCSTYQANLQSSGMPSGYYGYCFLGDGSVGISGYSAMTGNGGAFLVTSYSNAQNTCSAIGSNCSGVVRCTR